MRFKYEIMKWMNETLLHTPKNRFFSEQDKYNKNTIKTTLFLFQNLVKHLCFKIFLKVYWTFAQF